MCAVVFCYCRWNLLQFMRGQCVSGLLPMLLLSTAAAAAGPAPAVAYNYWAPGCKRHGITRRIWRARVHLYELCVRLHITRSVCVSFKCRNAAVLVGENLRSARANTCRPLAHTHTHTFGLDASGSCTCNGTYLMTYCILITMAWQY